MNLDQRVRALAALGDHLRTLGENELQTILENAANDNPWFTPASVKQALFSIQSWLTEESLMQWAGAYHPSIAVKRVAIIMAGNIPLVGIHDLLAVLISGHTAVIKLSSKDRFLPEMFIGKLVSIEPGFGPHIEVVEQLKRFDAVIATGSDNSARYFDFYFGKYPHVIRRNRTSVAILTGKETESDLRSLGDDVFTYFGLGCRNVSKIFVPEGYVFNTLFETWQSFEFVINHHKYANNYDYQKSLRLINREPFLDNGFVLLQKTEKIVSPISVLFHDSYQSDEQLSSMLTASREKIQVIVGDRPQLTTVRFGEAQQPSLTDYADRVDTMEFLAGLS